MTTILELKEKMIRFYGRYEVYITPIAKFVVAFVIFCMINLNIGYMKSISRTPIALILALLCSILPAGGTIFLVAAVILAICTRCPLRYVSWR